LVSALRKRKRKGKRSSQRALWKEEKTPRDTQQAERHHEDLSKMGGKKENLLFTQNRKGTFLGERSFFGKVLGLPVP